MRPTYAEAFATPISKGGPKEIIYPIEKKSSEKGEFCGLSQ
jgi:hypothetical protein